MSLESLLAQIKTAAELEVIESSDLFAVERVARATRAADGFQVAALFVVASVFERLARRADGEEGSLDSSGYRAIFDAACELLRTPNWAAGSSKMQFLVELLNPDRDSVH